uniref:Cytochrome c oxidase subunit 2 n=1 Tax=Cardiochiles fuscipennis TaxID=69312 RepID=A0A0A6ZKP3_9HYME|nr:cytochrome c oxidase subunit II [Cardiochiles fuscipennis]
MCTWMMWNLQDTFSVGGLFLTYFNDFGLLVIIKIMTMILYIMIWLIFNKFINIYILHNQMLEIIWTFFPMFILFLMAWPSIRILYILEVMFNPSLFSVKILGNQWFWSYEFNDVFKIQFDSFMIKNYDSLSNFRLLDVDHRLILPAYLPLRGLITSMDVIHSWTLPSMGIKVDSVPGRINQSIFKIKTLGLFYGQCSEICGMNHSFMPIVLESVMWDVFLHWMKSHKKN